MIIMFFGSTRNISFRRRACTPRRGFTLLEFEVAMVVFGIALVGLFPLTVMHSRVLRSLEKRYSAQSEWYLAASQDRWARKLGAAAALAATDPGSMPTPPLLVADDGDVDYADTGWTEEVDPSAFKTDLHRATPAEGQTATWTFFDVPAGWYQVQATWTESPTQVTDALYTIYDGDDLLGESTVDQQTAPVGEKYKSSTWQILVTEYFRAGSAQVQLHGQAAGEVVADGVRLVLLENDVQILSLDRSLGSEEVTAHVSVNVLVPQ